MENKNTNSNEHKPEITDIADDLDLLTEIKPDKNGQIHTAKPNESAGATGVTTETDLTADEQPLDNDFIAETDTPPGTKTEDDKTGDPADILNVSGDEFAGIIVTVSDMLQQRGFAAGFKKRVLNKDDRTRLKQLLAEQSATVKINRKYSAYENWLLRVNSEIEKYEEELPFKGDEKENLTNRLAAVLQKKNLKLTPEQALLATAVTITLPRLIPILMPDTEARPFEDDIITELKEPEKKAETVINITEEKKADGE
jgi:hypothetical protein